MNVRNGFSYHRAGGRSPSAAWYLATYADSPTSVVGNDIEQRQNGAFTCPRRNHPRHGRDEGQLIYEIEAEYAEQQADNEVEFQNVRKLNYTTDAMCRGRLTADTALIADDRDFVALSGHVVAISEKGLPAR